MDFIVGVHNLVRWLVVIVAVVAVARYGLCLLGKARPHNMDRGLMSAYTGLLDLNVLVGLILIGGRVIGGGQILPVWIEHAGTNLVAVAVAHFLAIRARRATDPQIAARTRLIGVGVSIGLIVLGVARVGGWS